MSAEEIVEKADLFKGRANIKLFLEIEVLDLNLKDNEEVMTYFGVGDDFKKFHTSNDLFYWTQIDPAKWTRHEEKPPNQTERVFVFQAPLKSPIARQCILKTGNEKMCSKYSAFCHLNCTVVGGGGAVKIQTKRKWVSGAYDDGKRAWNGDKQSTAKKTGKWPYGVKISQKSEPWPTEELLAHIFFYSESDESSYNQKKAELTKPLLNRILILHKGANLEYVVDHFVSL